MKSPNSKAPTDISSPNKASSTGNRLHLIELLGKGSNGKPQTAQAVFKTICCSPQTDSKFPIANGNTYTMN